MSKLFKFQNIFKLLIAIVFLYSCDKNDTPAPSPVKPKVVISFADSVTETSVVIAGFITDTGYAPIIDAGFYYRSDTSLITPTNTTSKISIGPLRGVGAFRAKITGLKPGTSYSIAAYARNSGGVGLSNDSLKSDYKITTVKLLEIGDTYGGGKVAYLMQPGDPTYDANVPHGLIVAIEDQSQGTKWTNAPNFISCSAFGVDLLQGKSNTDSIIKYNPSPIITAASIARAHRGGNYSDWYLPNKNELDKLYKNRIYIGGFTSNGYWSSTELANTLAWYVLFNDGVQRTNNKSATYRVRAIRVF